MGANLPHSVQTPSSPGTAGLECAIAAAAVQSSSSLGPETLFTSPNSLSIPCSFLRDSATISWRPAWIQALSPSPGAVPAPFGRFGETN